MIVFHELRLYWDWAGSNVGAMPACAIVAGVWALLSAVVFRKQLRRAWDWVKEEIHRPLRNELAAIRETADKAHRISADLYRQHTGYDHPDAPGGDDR